MFNFKFRVKWTRNSFLFFYFMCVCVSAFLILKIHFSMKKIAQFIVLKMYFIELVYT